MTGADERKIAVLCNPRSGKGRPVALLPVLEKYLNAHHLRFTSFTHTWPDTLHHFTEVILLGGDGTVNYMINRYRNLNIPVGLIPCGTGNDFGFDLLGRRTPEEYMETAVFGTLTAVDAGVCNERLFVNGAGIGFDGWVVKRLLAKKFFHGKAAYYSTVISLLLFFRESEVRITTDSGTASLPLFMFTAANCKSVGGGFRVAPKASFNDGLLECIAVSRIGLLKRLRYLPVIEQGRHLDKPLSFLKYEQSRSVCITSDSLLHAHLDGEYLAAHEFRIALKPAALQFRA